MAKHYTHAYESKIKWNSYKLKKTQIHHNQPNQSTVSGSPKFSQSHLTTISCQKSMMKKMKLSSIIQNHLLTLMMFNYIQLGHMCYLRNITNPLLLLSHLVLFCYLQLPLNSTINSTINSLQIIIIQ